MIGLPGRCRHCWLPEIERLLSAAAACSLAWLFPSPTHGFCFNSQSHMFSIGVPVYAAAVGDVTGDGLPDLFSCVSGAGALVRYRNLGGGEFLYDQALVTGAWPLNVILADVTGDGQLDAVVVEMNANSIRVFPAATDPSFAIPVGTRPQGVAVGDIDGDGISDMVVANAGSNTISVLLGSGAGDFQPQQPFSVGLAPNGVVVGDFNGDARGDVVVTSGGSPYGFDVLFGTSTGGLLPPAHYDTWGPAVTPAADLDLDGDLDLIANTENQTVPFLNDGTGLLVAVSSSFNGAGGSVGDVTGDGIPDVVGFDSHTDELLVSVGSGTGSFVSVHRYEWNGAGGRVAICDVNGDDQADLVVPQGEMSVYLNRGGGYFGPRMRWWAGNLPTGAALGRFNNDLSDDLLVAPSADSAVLYFSGAAAGFAEPAQQIVIARKPTAIIAGDFNNDGFLDGVVSCGTGNVVTLLPGMGNGTFGGRTEFATSSSPAILACGTFNSDGLQDLAVPCRTANVVSVLLNSGAGGFLAKTDYGTSSLPEAVAVGDLNHDGFADLVVACGGGIGKINVLLGRGDGTFQPRVNYSSYDIAKDVKLAYVDADSSLDAVVANYSGVAILLGNGLGGFGPPNQTVLFALESTVARDFDGDGLVDVAVNCVGGWITVLLGNGDGTFRDRVDYGCQDDTRFITSGDVTGDGWPDLVAVNTRVGMWPYYTTAGSISLLRNNALAISGVGPLFGDGAGRSSSILLSPPWPSPSSGAVTLEVSTRSVTVLDFLVSDVQGRVVRRLASTQMGQFPVQLRWDGKTDTGERARAGVYWLLARGAAGMASRRITIVR